ncbi:MAG: hypothetical protein M3252_07680 [Actinomycetota bacterium]|nr:hypothetical protein [Actinomycetota bacterium]
MLLEWLGPRDLSVSPRKPTPVWSDRSDVLTLEVDRLRQRRAASWLVAPPDSALGTIGAAGSHDLLRVHHAPYAPRLGRLRDRLRPLLRSDAAAGERREALHVLMVFARGGGWPPELLSADPPGESASHCLHEEAAWSLASVVLGARQVTPPHRHESWGAAVTIVGVERNLRYAGWPDHPRFIDEQIAPVGGGYLFEPELCHQAVDGSGDLTVSLHLLVRR